MSDPVKIKPIAPSFTQSDAKQPKRKRSFPWALAAIVVVLVAAYFLFQFLPQEGLTRPRSSPPSPQAANSDQPITSESAETQRRVLPFRDIELGRAEERAKQILQLFGKLQDKVEGGQLGLADARDVYDAIIDAANEADSSFGRREFELAIRQYAEATSRLQDYVDSKEMQFEEAFEKGFVALTARDLNTARDQLGLAGSIKPHDEALANANRRLEKLPEVNRLLREFQRARLQGDIERAESLVLEARNLDSQTVGLHEKLAELRRLDRSAMFDEVISSAFIALDAKKLDQAQSLFNRALEMKPGDKAAVSGLSAVKQALRLEEIARLKTLAEKQESQGLIELAMQTYIQALQLDENLQFAREGRLRTETTFRLNAAMDRFIDDPASLSTDSIFDAAQETLHQAKAHFASGSPETVKINQLANVIKLASQPIPIVLLSDNAMEVRLATVGDLGPFVRKELSLRPGRYLLTGSANGCKDIRKTILVEANMVPIAIRCNEPI